MTTITTRPDPGENPPEECWMLHGWLEPEPPRPPDYALALAALLAAIPGPTGIGTA